MSGPLVVADPVPSHAGAASWLIAAIDYLWPWNLVLLLAYLSLWYSTSTRDIAQLRLFGAVASGMFVLFGLVATIWPMVAFNLLFLVTQVRRLVELRRPRAALGRPVAATPSRGALDHRASSRVAAGPVGEVPRSTDLRFSTIVHYTDRPTTRIHRFADRSCVGSSSGSSAGLVGQGVDGATSAGPAELDEATENRVLRKLLAEALVAQTLAGPAE